MTAKDHKPPGAYNIRRTILLLLVLCLGSVLLLLLLLPGGVQADSHYVDDDAPSGGDGTSSSPFNTIQEAVNAAEVGDTIRIWEGSYQENVVVNLSLDIVGNGSAEVSINGKGESAAMTIQAPWCNLSGCAFTSGGAQWTEAGLMVKANHTVVRNCSGSGSAYGIYLSEAYHCQLLDNSAFGNSRAGITLSSSGENVLARNNCSDNIENGDGIMLSQSSHNTLESNVLQANGNDGISCQANTRFNSYLNNSVLDNWKTGLEITTEENMLRGNIFSGNGQSYVLRGNIFFGNGHNFGYSPGTFPGFNYQETVIDETNLVEGKPVYFITDREEFTIDESWNPGTIYLINCRKVTVRNVELSGNLHGIFLYGTDDSLFENVSFTDCGYAMFLHGGSSRNRLINCDIYENDIGFFNYDGRNNEILDSLVLYNRYGLGLYHDETSVVGNNISGNLRGIQIQEGLDNKVEYNNITDNRVGIHFYRFSNPAEGDSNIIRFNNFQGNRDFGVNASSNNQITADVTNNFWGSASGPYHKSKNPNGEGDNITEFLDFEPWLDQKVEFKLESDSSQDDEIKIDPGLLLSLTVLGLVLLLLVAILTMETLYYHLLHLFVPLYTRIGGGKIDQDIAKQNTRGRVYIYIQDNPGVNFSTVYRSLALGIGTVVYHLSVLQREGYIRSSTQGSLRLFWAKSDFPGPREASLTDLQGRILNLLEERGELSRAELRGLTGIHKATLRYNIRQLEERGVLKERKQGSENYCSLCERKGPGY